MIISLVWLGSTAGGQSQVRNSVKLKYDVFLNLYAYFFLLKLILLYMTLVIMCVVSQSLSNAVYLTVIVYAHTSKQFRWITMTLKCWVTHSDGEYCPFMSAWHCALVIVILLGKLGLFNFDHLEIWKFIHFSLMCSQSDESIWISEGYCNINNCQV